ncbi:MAG: DUF3575 domain-containing protein [Cyclobacteriaceae bacterium]
MKKQLVFCLMLGLLAYPTANIWAQEFGELDYDKNIVKLNLTALPLGSFDVQYERVVARKMSFAVSFRTIPQGGIPLVSQFTSSEEDLDQLDNARFGNFAITPEFRFYMGKKDGPRGFYLAPFFRYSSINLQFPEYRIDDSGSMQGKTIDMEGNITGISGGLMLGSQWRLGKRVYLDWWILGGGYGSSSGEISGSTSLTPAEQEDLRIELNDFDTGFVDTQVEVDGDGARVGFDGPWATLRGGIALGIKF